VPDVDERQALVELARSAYLDAPTDDLGAALDRLVALPYWVTSFDGSLSSLAALKRMTSELIARLSTAAIDATRAAHGDGPLRRYAASLVVPPRARAECAILKAVADRYVMRRAEAVRAQARQREQLTELATALLDHAPPSLETWLHDAWKAATHDAARLRVVVDQVASLTDTSALAWHERWVR
jgi:dGTPase